MAYEGSKGNLHIYLPNSVILPFSSIASNKNNYFKAYNIVSLSGFSIKSKLKTSLIFIFFKPSITFAKFTLKISGLDCSYI